MCSGVWSSSFHELSLLDLFTLWSIQYRKAWLKKVILWHRTFRICDASSHFRPLFRAMCIRGQRRPRSACKSAQSDITKTYLYNFDLFKPHFYIVKLVFTGCTLFFLFHLKNIDCGHSLEPPRGGGSNEYSQSMFWAEIWKISEYLSDNFQIFSELLGGEIFNTIE